MHLSLIILSYIKRSKLSTIFCHIYNLISYKTVLMGKIATVNPRFKKYALLVIPAGRLIYSSFVVQWSIQKILELFAAARVAQLSQCFRLNLADALAGDVKFLADLLKRARMAVLQTEAQGKDLFLARRERFEHVAELLLEQQHGGRVRRGERVVIRDEIAQVAVLLLADGRF